MEDAEAKASNHGEGTSNSYPNNQNRIFEQLLSTLVAMQQTQ